MKIWQYLIVIGLFSVLSGCKDSKVIENQTSLSQSSVTQFDGTVSNLITEDYQVIFQNFQSKGDIEEQAGLFIFAEITNKSDVIIYPEAVWRTHVALVEVGSETSDGFYGAVLTREDLAGSTYKTAVDQMSLPLKPNDTSLVGFFYGTGGKEVELVLYDEKFQELRRLEIEEK